MKSLTAIILCVLTMPQFSFAKGFIGTVDKYIYETSNKIIEIGSTSISDDGLTARTYDYSLRKEISVNLNEVSKSTREEVANVKAGRMILVTTATSLDPNARVERYCEVFSLFLNKKAYVGCKSYSMDIINGYQRPNRLDFIINNVENGVTPEVLELSGFSKNEIVELNVATQEIKAKKTVKILAIFSNGEALIQKLGFGLIDTGSIVYKSGIEKVRLEDLSKLNVSVTATSIDN